MENTQNCEECNYEYTYMDGIYLVCPMCNHQFLPSNDATDNRKFDINGQELFNGDSVTVIKDLKIKGSGSTIKRGTKVRNIRIVPDDGVGHDIECKFDGVGTIKLKTTLVKK